MPWSIVQIKERKGKRSVKSIEVVPEGWIKNGFLYWPPKNQKTLQKEEFSKIDLDQWTPYECKVFISDLTDFDVADRKANELKPIVSDIDTSKKPKQTMTSSMYNIDDGTGLKSIAAGLPVSCRLCVHSRLCTIIFC